MRESGIMITTPNEARVRGDLILLVGAGLTKAWPDLETRLLAKPLAAEIGGGARRVVWLCPGREGVKADSVRIVGRDSRDLPVLLAALRARVGGRSAGKASVSGKALDVLAADLKAARFGVAVWSAAELDALTIEMLCGLVKDLNAGTRFTGLPLAPGDNALGVQQACGWMTGISGAHRLRARLSGARSVALRCAAPDRERRGRLRSSGSRPIEQPFRPVMTPAPDDDRAVRTGYDRIAIMRRSASRSAARALDHDAVEHCPATGTLVGRGGQQVRATRSRSPMRSARSLPICRTPEPGHADAHHRRPRHRPRPRARRRRRRVDARRPHRRRAARRPRRRDPRCDRQDRHGGRDRHPLPHRRRQREHGAPAAAGTSSRVGAAPGAHAAVDRRLVHLRDRLPLCRKWASPPWSSPRCRRITRCTRISSSPTSRSSTRRRSRCSATTISCSA